MPELKHVTKKKDTNHKNPSTNPPKHENTPLATSPGPNIAGREIAAENVTTQVIAAQNTAAEKIKREVNLSSASW